MKRERGRNWGEIETEKSFWGEKKWEKAKRKIGKIIPVHERFLIWFQVFRLNFNVPFKYLSLSFYLYTYLYIST